MSGQNLIFNLSVLLNPFFAYITSWVIAIFIYLIGWSDLYPPLSLSVVMFLSGTSLFTILFFYWFPFKKYLYNKPEFEVVPASNLKLLITTLVILALYLLNFLCLGTVPLLEVILGGDYLYTTKGIPFLHGFIGTFNSFYATYLFYLYLATMDRTKLYIFFLNVLPSILMIARGMTMIIFFNVLLIFIYFNKDQIIKNIVKIFIFIFVVFLFFGFIGNIRTGSLYSDKTDLNESILNIGQASDEFRNLNLPKELFWGYLYISSPLSNFQNTVNVLEKKHYMSVDNFIEMIGYECIPGVISNPIMKSFSIEKEVPCLITEALNVSGFYTRSFVYMNWFGPLFMFLTLLIYIVLYFLCLGRSNRFKIVGVVLLTNLVYFNVFDNMIAFSGMSFQLVYPVIFGRISFLRKLIL